MAITLHLPDPIIEAAIVEAFSGGIGGGSPIRWVIVEKGLARESYIVIAPTQPRHALQFIYLPSDIPYALCYVIPSTYIVT